MYAHLLATHSVLRWLVFIALVISVVRAWYGYKSGAIYGKTDGKLRTWTIIFFHIQLIIGMVLYVVSPVIQVFWDNMKQPLSYFDGFYFGVIHFVAMAAAVGLVTVGSAKARRASTDGERFRNVAVWFTIALILILIAVPWPGSPLAERPMWRAF